VRDCVCACRECGGGGGSNDSTVAVAMMMLIQDVEVVMAASFGAISKLLHVRCGGCGWQRFFCIPQTLNDKSQGMRPSAVQASHTNITTATATTPTPAPRQQYSLTTHIGRSFLPPASVGCTTAHPAPTRLHTRLPNQRTLTHSLPSRWHLSQPRPTAGRHEKWTTTQLEVEGRRLMTGDSATTDGPGR
jgi:hypothetical protein